MELLIPISIPSYRSVLSSSPLDNGWLNSLEVRHLVNSRAPVSLVTPAWILLADTFI